MDVTKPRNPRYVGILALVSCLILIGGWLARPRDLPQNPEPIPSETELEQLERRTERRSLDSMPKYFAGVAKDVAASVAHARGGRVSGIVWDEQRIVTAPIADGSEPRAATFAAASTAVDGQPAIWGPNLPLAAVAIDRKPELTPAHRATALPQPGEWLVAVWRTDRAPAFAAGNFRETVSATCGVTPVDEVVSSLLLAGSMAGGGLFDLDGRLVGMLLPCDGRVTAIATASIEHILTGANTIEQRVRGTFGLGLEPLSPEEQSYFKTTGGLLVREVWRGYAGDSLRAGDIVMAVNGLDVTSVNDLRAMTTRPDAAVALSILRGAQRLTMALPGDGSEALPGTAPDATGLMMASSPTAYRIGAVRPGSPAALAGVQAGDRLVRINQSEPRNLIQINRIVSGDTRLPMWLEVERGARRLGMLVR